MTTHPLTISYTNQDSVGGGACKSWCGLRVDGDDEKLTISAAAAMVDALYDRQPCVSDEDQPPVPDVDPADIEKAGKTVDAELCQQLMSGDYTIGIRVIKSDPDQNHQAIIIGPGEIISTVPTEASVTYSLTVEAAESATMLYPLYGGGEVSAVWVGVSGPEIKQHCEELFWEGVMTGEISITHNTKYDLVTVAVPGIPKYEGSDRGDPQEFDLLIFYNLQAYRESFSSPNDYDSIGEVCGWGGGGGGGEEPPDPEDPPEPPPPEDPCVVENPRLDDPNYYEQVCCTPPPFGLPDCEKWKAGTVKSEGMSDAEKERWRAKTEYCEAGICYQVSAVELVGVGPAPGETCGDVYHQIEVDWKNCCDYIPPLTAHPDNPTEISSNSSVVLCVLGGGPILTWEAGGGLYFHDAFGNHVHQIKTGNSDPTCVRVYAPKDFCENSKVQVEDECTEVSMNLHKPDADPLVLCDENHQDIIMAPNSYYDFGLLVSGGVPPYTGWSSDKLEHIANGLFKAPDDFCGTATVHVMDSCMEEAECTVRSTEGHWEAVPNFDHCILPVSGLLVPETPMAIESQTGAFVGKGYKATISHVLAGWSWHCSEAEVWLVCPVGNVLTTHSTAFWTNYCMNYGYASFCGYEKEFSNGCCKNDSSGMNSCSTAPSWHYFAGGDYVIDLLKWVCP